MNIITTITTPTQPVTISHYQANVLSASLLLCPKGIVTGDTLVDVETTNELCVAITTMVLSQPDPYTIHIALQELNVLIGILQQGYTSATPEHVGSHNSRMMRVVYSDLINVFKQKRTDAFINFNY